MSSLDIGKNKSTRCFNISQSFFQDLDTPQKVALSCLIMSPVSTCGSCPKGHCKTPAQQRPAFTQNANLSAGNSREYCSIEKYQAEADRYNAFVVGQSTSLHKSPSETNRELQKWEEDWQKGQDSHREDSHSNQ